MPSPRNHWLTKSEPDVYSIDDLARDGRTPWEGVRNYQARNCMRDRLRAGDPVLFYHSSVSPAGVAGIGKVLRSGLPDPTAFDPKSDYYDPKSDPDHPRWIMVEVGFVEKFKHLVSLDDMRSRPELAGMPVLRRGQRLSVQPVEAEHFRIVCRMGRATRRQP